MLKKKRKYTNQKVVYVDELPWAKRLQKRCKARLKRGEDPTYFGRCELRVGHYTESGNDDHCLDRGMVWVRWTNRKQIRYETPQYKAVEK